ncbi:efflux RND transporter periplasmic adaptor subunit [Pulveribacter sp.]|uniref:efflux RND transporter periplasmic adaptor subunit n=1 Tax=Pulveribacter sp. TaxID=2678893 RepID=UPI003917BDD1
MTTAIRDRLPPLSATGPAYVTATAVRRAAVALAMAAVLAGCGGGGNGNGGAKPAAQAAPEVGVLTLQPERQVVTNELPGRTSAWLAAEIRPQVGGIVQKRLFTEGAQVQAGQVLYQLDAASFEVALSAARAQLERARANLGTAQTNARRNAELVKIDAISRQAYDDSQAAVTQAQSDVAVAQAAVQAAQINLGYTRIKSPIAGRTSTSTVTPGALVTANQAAALTTVTQIDPLYVDVTQSSTELLRLKNDLASGRIQRAEGGKNGEARVTLLLDDGSPYPHAGRLQFSGVQVNPGTGAILLRAVVPNPDGVLMPGMYVRAVLEAGVNEQALLAPQQSVRRDPAGNASVLVVTPEDKVETRRIVTGAAVGSRWEVLSGLAAGERVLVDGAQRVRPGDSVKPVPWVPRAAPASAAAASAASTAG